MVPATRSTRPRTLAHLSNHEIERRLEEAPEDVSIKDLAMVAGIASDKIAKYERWGVQERDDNQERQTRGAGPS
jgi:hypothetical protein